MSELANRLKKNVKRLAPWAERERLACYRVYDRDIPQIPLTIDRYGDHVLVNVYETRTGTPRAKVDAWCAELCAALAIEPARVHVKLRERAAGGEQYVSGADEAPRIAVGERDLMFYVRFSDAIDVGLFLDHRNLRQIVREEARDKRVLNLFAYTGSFSVYAAAGGASQVTTVDLSAKVCGWFEDNLALNFAEQMRAKSAVIVADAREWLRSDSSSSFDLIVIDPPTISKSKRAPESFDVQRDHAELIALAQKKLARDGVIYFSTNFTRFELDPAIAGSIAEITDRTVPIDFSHRPHVHRTFRITK